MHFPTVSMFIHLSCASNSQINFNVRLYDSNTNFHDSIFCGLIVALNALKRKKRLEKQLTQIDGTLSTIEFQREALENANTNTEVLKAMGYAAKAMKSAHQEL